MGGSSSSSSSSSQKTETQNYDQKVTATDGGAAIGAGANVELNLTDYGVIEKAGELLGGVIKQTIDAFTTADKEKNEILSAKLEDDQKEIASLALKGLIAVGLVVVVIGVFRK